MERLKKEFFEQNADIVAEKLIGKMLCAKVDGKTVKSVITEVEAYFGEDDSASHARFGKNSKASSMWADGGTIWVYLCYGMHYMLNITTGKKGDPQAVLLRGVKDASGPGRLSKFFEVTPNDCLSKVYCGGRIWIEDTQTLPSERTKRVGIDFAKEKDREAKLRFLCKKGEKL